MLYSQLPAWSSKFCVGISGSAGFRRACRGVGGSAAVLPRRRAASRCSLPASNATRVILTVWKQHVEASHFRASSQITMRAWFAACFACATLSLVQARGALRPQAGSNRRQLQSTADCIPRSTPYCMDEPNNPECTCGSCDQVQISDFRLALATKLLTPFSLTRVAFCRTV